MPCIPTACSNTPTMPCHQLLVPPLYCPCLPILSRERRRRKRGERLSLCLNPRGHRYTVVEVVVLFFDGEAGDNSPQGFLCGRDWTISFSHNAESASLPQHDVPQPIQGYACGSIMQPDDLPHLGSSTFNQLLDIPSSSQTPRHIGYPSLPTDVVSPRQHIKWFVYPFSHDAESSSLPQHDLPQPMQGYADGSIMQPTDLPHLGVLPRTNFALTSVGVCLPKLVSLSSSILSKTLTLLLSEGIIPGFLHLKNPFLLSISFSISICIASHWLWTLNSSSFSFFITICWALISRFNMSVELGLFREQNSTEQAKVHFEQRAGMLLVRVFDSLSICKEPSYLALTHLDVPATI
ncbi:hypothetical protein F3Y22_tig00113124pilonHSYRG00526 [Hibiscus syriacus]|uniref:Uncharacterized protein n=1 Tax=Hibiscus syriacus TaxID=106335 RepID=A0A6A2WRQ0_HIBSY|nr:hypothetical protein F3Y22_tig00113124pilonHSYRG00526 [Hibiscus syriacus]